MPKHANGQYNTVYRYIFIVVAIFITLLQNYDNSNMTYFDRNAKEKEMYI